ncbi:MAG TPA: polyketide synthase dehydratase domain-containing protein, partial [Micromonospora sp.]
MAAVNGPAATVVAGDPATCAELVAICDERNIRARRVEVDYASHSAQVDGLRDELIEALAPIAPTAGDVVFVSTVGEAARVDTTSLGAGYWFENLRRRVDFAGAVRLLREQGHSIFVEVSPHPVLVPGLPDEVTGIGSLRRDDGGTERFLTSVAEAWAHGVTVDWEAVFAGQDARRIVLPTYPFQRQRYWLAEQVSGHPLVGDPVDWSDGVVFAGTLSLTAQPWLADHLVGGVALLPGAALVELAGQVGDRVLELTLGVPLVVPRQGTVRIRVVAGPADEDGNRPVVVESRPEPADQEMPADQRAGDADWVRHAEGLVGRWQEEAPARHTEPWPPSGAEPVPVDGVYERAAVAGFAYGPAFQGLRAAWRRDGEVFAEVALPAEQADEAYRYGLHPALLDAALHAVALLPANDSETGPGRLPFSWREVRRHRPGATALRVRAAVDRDGAVRLTGVDPAGAPVVSVDALITRPVSVEQLRAEYGTREDHLPLFRLDWAPLPGPTGTGVGRTGPGTGAGGGLRAAVGFTADEPLPAADEAYPDLAALTAALDGGAAVPE